MILYLLYKGVPGDDQVHQCIFDGSGWGQPQTFPQMTTTTHVAWASYYDQTLFAAWREEASPHRVFAARFDGPNIWSWLGPVPGALTGAGPGAAFSPPGRMMMAWKAVGSDSSIHYASFDSLHWSPTAQLAPPGTSHGPALAFFHGRIHMVWKGPPGDESIYHAEHDGSAWLAAALVPGVATASSPALMVHGDRLVLACRGPEGDHSIYWTSRSSGSPQWGPRAKVKNFETGTGPTLAVLDDRLHMAWKGVGDDFSVYTTNFDGSFWWDAHRIPHAASSSSPSLAPFDPAF